MGNSSVSLTGRYEDRTMDYLSFLSREIGSKAPAEYRGQGIEGDCLIVPEEQGEGRFQRIRARNSLEIWRIRMRLSEPLHLDFNLSVPRFEVCYCRSGYLTVRSETDDRSHDYSDGDMTINLKNYKGRMCYRADMIQEFVCFYFHQDFIDSLPDDGGTLRLSDIDEEKKNFLYSPRQAPLEIRKPFEEILDYPYSDMGSHFFFEAKSMEILAAVLRYYFSESEEGGRSCPSASDMRALEDAARLIEENLDRNITIAGLSEMVGLNSHKLTQGFRRQFGSSINAYRKELRMRKSLQLLSSGTLNISETALMIGYQNIGHFSSDFRRYYGQTPRDYLKNSRFH